MEYGFQIPITYMGKEVELEAKLLTIGYTHRFIVDIDGVSVMYEPHAGGKYIPMLDDKSLKMPLKENLQLVNLVGERIEELFTDH